MSKDPRNHESASSLRGDLDKGRGRDKVDFPDPAAAPLGTDDEAAGTPITEEQARMAHDHEIRDPDDQESRKGPYLTDNTLRPRSDLNTGSSQGKSNTAMLVTVGIVLFVMVLILLFVFPGT